MCQAEGGCGFLAMDAAGQAGFAPCASYHFKRADVRAGVSKLVEGAPHLPDVGRYGFSWVN
jgi:hypothetical protein